MYVATFTPPQGNRTATATISATITGATEENQTDSQVVNLVSVRPGQLSISSDPAILSKTHRDFSVRAQVLDPMGWVFRPSTRLSCQGGPDQRIHPGPRCGDYQTTFTTTSDGPVEIVATVAAAERQSAPPNLGLPSSEIVTNNGKDSTMVTILTVDEFGYQ